MNEMFVRLAQFFDYAKKIAGIWDDLTEFFYEANPAYKKVGSTPRQHDRHRHLRSSGRLRRHLRERRRLGRSPLGDARRDRRRQARDDRPAHDQHRARGVRRALVLRGVDGQRAAAALRHRSRGQAAVAVPPVEQDHQAASAGTELEGEVHLGYGAALGPLRDGGRLLLAAVEHRGGAEAAGQTRSSKSTGHSLKVRVPKGALPEMELEWHVPEVWNAFERNRARAHCVVVHGSWWR